jgi:ABC-type nitrate/sulfonate/bicarbonate transport system substrate-binding protein
VFASARASLPRRSRLTIVLALVVVLISVLCTSAAPAAPRRASGHASQKLATISLALGFQWQSQFIPVLYGLNQGYFRREGIDLHIIPVSGPLQALQLIAAGKVNFSLPDFDSEILAVAAGETDTKIVWVYEPRPGTGFASLQPYPTPQSLVGKTYSTTSTSNSDVIIKNLMKAHGLDPNSVNVKKLDFSVLYASLFQRSVDAVEADTPGSWRSLQREAQKMGVNIYHTYLGSSAWGLIGYNHVLVAGEALIKDRPGIVRRFVAAIAKSQAAARKLSGAKVASLLATVTQVADPVAVAEDFADYKALTVGAGPTNPKIVSHEISYLLGTGQLSHSPSLGSIYTNAFIPKAPKKKTKK